MSKADLYLEYWTAKMPAVIAGLQANAPIDITDIAEKASDRKYGVTFKIANQKFYAVGSDEEKAKAPRTYVRYFFDVFKGTDYFKEHLATKTLVIKISHRAANEAIPITLTINVDEAVESPNEKHKGIDHFIDLYKKLISNQLPELGYSEIYKWETFQHFQSNWRDDHHAGNIVEVLKKSFNKESNNLWSGQNFFPLGMLLGFAEQDGATVSSMFKNLYDENISLEKRFEHFITKSEELLKVRFPQDDKVHYQSDRVLILYLALRYPDKYYLYKSKMFRTFCELTRFWEFPKVKKGDTFTKVKSYTEMCEALHPILEADNELLALHKARLPETITFHDADHLLTQDFIYSVTTYLNKDLPMDDSEKYFLDVLRSYSNEHAIFYFSTLDKILSHLNLTGPDKRITFSCKANQLNFIIGHRYGFVLLKEQGNTLYGTMTSKPFGASAVPFGNGSPLFYSKLTIPEVSQHVQDAHVACASQLNRIDQSRDAANNNLYFEKAVFDKEYRNRILNTPVAMAQTSCSLNQILFGPPGTGKTYHSINHAISIIEGKELGVLKLEDRTILKSRFENYVKSGQVVFTTFHQSMSYEDFIEGIKPLKPMVTDTFIKYDIQDGIFKKLCNEARSNFENSKNENKGKIAFELAFEKLHEEWEEDPTMKFPLKTEGYEFSITGFTNTSIQFKKASGGTGHTLSINTLKDLYYGKEYNFKQGVGIYYPGVLTKLNSYSSGITSITSLKPYLLIIDEINRGNVSQIFGELITLIEDDKRLGNAEAIEIILPYSKEKFGVPPNLYIIGTMNTADRSIEALDTALRRRFAFLEMPANAEVIRTEGRLKPTGKIGNLDVVKMLVKINERIGKLIDKDHKIGHSFFMNIETEADLKRAFKDKVIPLLEEYFFGDFGKIGLVLGNSFIEKANDSFTFASFSGYDEAVIDDLKERPIFRIKEHSYWSFTSIYE